MFEKLVTFVTTNNNNTRGRGRWARMPTPVLEPLQISYHLGSLCGAGFLTYICGGRSHGNAPVHVRSLAPLALATELVTRQVNVIVAGGGCVADGEPPEV